MFKKADTYLIFGVENRFYFTGFRSSFGCVILTENEKYLLTDARYASEARTLLSGIMIVNTTAQSFYGDIAEILSSIGAKSVGYEDDVLSVREFQALKEALYSVELLPASDELSAKRAIKTDMEIDNIAQAQALTQKALSKVLPLIKVGVTEKEISDEITYRMLTLGAECNAFDNIVAFGENTANPHHHPKNRKLERNDMITIDIGARLNGWCGDMTRTFSLGTPDETLVKMHDIVKKAQAFALSNITAGMTGREAHLLAYEYIMANGYGNDFIHSLGHGVGVYVHEAPTLGMRSDDVLAENMVVSVEPGIYVDGLGGIRIEDLVVVKKDGVINLTNFDKSINL